VKSLLVQTWQNIEVIIVDDASTDGTYALAEEFSRRDCRIKVVRLDQNVGLWGAKNVGLQHCSGDFVTMHDADDWSHPQKLELQVYPLLADTCLQATSSYMLRVDQKTGIPFTRNARNYLRWNPSSFMFRAKLVVELGGFIDSLLGSDCEFIARAEIAYGVSSHVQIRKPLSIGLQRVRSLSNRYRSADDGLLRLRHWEDWRLWHSGKKSQSEPKKIMSPPKIRSSQGWASNC
jgi:glycosyltransferase involved in cell wall biosynthesis